MAAGAAGISAILDRGRPYWMGLSLLLIAVAFWQYRRAGQCRRGPDRWSGVILGLSTVLLLLFFLFPQAVAGWIADWLPTPK
jgi:hypothetical protein